MTGPSDRAAVVATAILQIITSTLRNRELHERVANLLRDEFIELTHQTAVERDRLED